jgi:hypothetical protein
MPRLRFPNTAGLLLALELVELQIPGEEPLTRLCAFLVFILDPQQLTDCGVQHSKRILPNSRARHYTRKRRGSAAGGPRPLNPAYTGRPVWTSSFGLYCCTHGRPVKLNASQGSWTPCAEMRRSGVHVAGAQRFAKQSGKIVDLIPAHRPDHSLRGDRGELNTWIDIVQSATLSGLVSRLLFSTKITSCMGKHGGQGLLRV